MVMDEKAFEQRLNTLMQGNSPENRKKHALKAKSEGKKVIGLLCSYAPEEVIYAAGMFPWRVTGTWDSDLSRATVYRDLDTCGYCNHALEAVLRGDLEFLDGIVASDWDDDRRRLFDTWCYVSHPAFAMTYTSPKNRSPILENFIAEEISMMASALEKFGGTKITEERLWQAIKTYNQTRRLLMQLYQLRKRPEPPLSGPEMLGITTACTVMDKADFNAELGSLLPYIEQRKTEHKASEPRILVSSDLLDNPQFLEIIESEGCQIVMDDLDTGSRYAYKLVDENASDPVQALAHRICWRPADSTAYNWEEQIKQVIEWAREFRADGVIDLYEEFSPPRQWMAPLLVRELAKVNIPLVRIGRSYDVSSVGQLRTRVAAFLEML
ncbi:MAG: 2-hydroxyacyl-CoA dehydratase [Chloroflexi bacterium]|nr:2-hydroxyacyl-CoA dehydratase [Chloroflexota bacterium]